MRDDLDLVRFPVEDPDGAAGRALTARCRADYERFGWFELDGLVAPAALRRALAESAPPALASSGPDRSGRRGVDPDPPPGAPAALPAPSGVDGPGVPPGPARVGGGLLARIHDHAGLTGFLARAVDRPGLRPAAEGPTLTRFDDGESAGWRIWRAELTAILTLQAPLFGGEFEYVRELRGGGGPDPDGIAALLAEGLAPAQPRLMPGTLTVFGGGDAAHRVTPVAGATPRILAEFAYTTSPAARAGARRAAAAAR